MANPRCVFNAASALRRVFLSGLPTETTPSASTSLLRSTPIFPSSSSSSSLLQTRIQTRSIFKSTSTAVAEQRLPRDNEITAPYLRLKNAEGKLDPPARTAQILRSMDLKTHMLEVIAFSDEGLAPIARIVNKRELFQKKKEAKKSKNPGTVTKTIEMNWAIEKNDLGHRLEKMRGFLERGNKVEVILAGKKKGRKASVEEAEAVIVRIREFVAGVEGAKERVKMDGKVLGMAVLSFEGKVVKKGEGEREREREREEGSKEENEKLKAAN
ncbi:putative translation initiation factor protein [Botrytis cinerea BcDW1]|uniref:Putative translation initiation factor protein n=1 Tax=Botryotinia fuckeliana (strain BcDW1) TaxID=1290391 RepID=M7U3Q2_BOTF1|nr:putative translation initiation factor protein [Botrytis cinerea BcDW1]